ncbi:MAG: hypothetical protein M0P61_05420 [Ignavibacteriaceae bacterium]|jgi:hypothetical protein|nr:hypothetical protein [Ignavibacteriaceae bacterium]
MISSSSSNQSKQRTGKFRTVFILLFALAVFLLIANILLSFFTPKEIEINTSEIPSDEINSLFLKSVSEFYLDDGLLQKIKSPKKKEDSLTHSYRLTLPYDVPIPVFLHSIFGNFTGKNVSISSLEMILNKKSLLEISSGKKQKFYTEIFQDTSIHRDNGSIAFALTDYENLSEVELKKLLEIPESFAFLLQPKNKSTEFTKTILEARKEYIVEITVSSPNSEFTLAEKFPFVRNKLAVNSLLRYYPRNTFFFVHPLSSLLSSNMFEKVRKEFTKRKYALYSSNSFTNLSEVKDNEVETRFYGEIEKLKKAKIILMLLPADYFYTSFDKIKNIKKKGIRFVLPSTAVIQLKGK